MLVSFYVLFIWIFVGWAESSGGDNLYQNALEKLSHIKHPYEDTYPLYTREDIENNLYIPQFDIEVHDYVGRRNIHSESVNEEVIPLLEEAAAGGHADALLTLADFYVFGNYSVETNYSRGLEYYHRVIESRPDPHAYFMLGILYANGAFGELQIDQFRASVYFEFGASNGDFNSILAMAYRYSMGIGVKEDCEMAQYYYTRAAQIGIDYLNSMGDAQYDVWKNILYNIRISDFNGGLYGRNLGRTSSSLIRYSDRVLRKTLLNENFDFDLDITDSYLNVIDYFEGDYFTPRNYTKAFKLANECVVYGDLSRGSEEVFIGTMSLDSYYLSRCEGLLGEMYLKGLGTERNYELAAHWLNKSLAARNDSWELFVNRGYMYEKGLITGTPDNPKAFSDYASAIWILKSDEPKVRLADFFMRQTNSSIFLSPYKKDIYTLIQRAVLSDHFISKSAYYYNEFLQSGLGEEMEGKKYTCPMSLFYLSTFVKNLEYISLIPHLKIAFDELRYGQFKNSLMAYLIAAEQGFHHAQISAAYLLYQLQPLNSRHERKTFDKARIDQAIKYLEYGAQYYNLDAFLVLGDIYFDGIEGAVSPDLDKSFEYYSRATHFNSSYACFKLGYIYEYGLTNDKSIDFFMAKRYYDLSLRYLEKYNAGYQISKTPVHFALLRLRLKFLFGRSNHTTANLNNEKEGWFKAFKMAAKSDDTERNPTNDHTDERNTFHEGRYYGEDEYEGTAFADSVGFFFTVMLFMFFFIFNIFQRVGAQRNNDVPGRDGLGDNANRPGQGFDGNRFRFRRANFEFHFIAL